jgi:hypothetical protein
MWLCYDTISCQSYESHDNHENYHISNNNLTFDIRKNGAWLRNYSLWIDVNEVDIYPYCLSDLDFWFLLDVLTRVYDIRTKITTVLT